MSSDGHPRFIAGVPPDYFSETGQRWGNPIYDWDYLAEHGFDFLTDRIAYTAKLYDMIRIDHFRAFDTYWKIPSECPTAREGEWVEAPGVEFFDKLLPMIPDTGIVAEDLGMMRPEVYALRDRYHFPGMNVVQFTILDPKFEMNENMITYTGTHDNAMIRAWYEGMEEWERAQADAVLDRAGIPGGPAYLRYVRYALSLPTATCILPVQDLLGLGNEARINVPSVVDDVNWTWKLRDYTGVREALSVFRE